jgi:signal peptidase I
MEPIFIKGDHILAIKSHKLKRGDIVFFKHADSDHLRVKRIIGLPGEKFEMINSKILINDVKLANYIHYCNRESNYGPVQIPEDHYFLLGDNRDISKDSRYFGPISVDEILYKALAIYRPISHFKILL